jgi:oxygen-independent coproporphyrinogen-3 oxidase
MPPPLALYVHLPWCVRKCPYCDFNSHPVPGAGLPEDAYVVALLEDLAFAAQDVPGRPLISVFFGGGTPSLFSPRSIARVLDRAAALLGAAGEVEVTLEANPGAIERGRFAEYRQAGVTRISLGAQSFDARALTALGRIHAADDTRAAVIELLDAGIENFNLDLMYALPGQTVADALDDVEQAVALGPTHLSHYQLTLEPGTAFYHRPPPLPDDDTAFEMQELCQSRLAAAGFRQYEVSGYSCIGRECVHNLNYWRFGDYIGVGAGAHGKVSGIGGVLRTARHRQPARYLAAERPEERIAERRPVPREELPFEFCLNALRLVDGFTTGLFEERTGLESESIAAALDEAVTRRLLLRDGIHIVPTLLGRRFLNDLQAIFLPDGRSDSRRTERPTATAAPV